MDRETWANRSAETREIKNLENGGQCRKVGYESCTPLLLEAGDQRSDGEISVILAAIPEAVLPESYAEFWVTRRSGGVVRRHFNDLDAVFEFRGGASARRSRYSRVGAAC
jgi:hypothetical protein